MKNSLANLSLTPEKGGETSIGTSRFPLNKLLKQFIIKIVTKMRKIFHFHLITFLLFAHFCFGHKNLTYQV